MSELPQPLEPKGRFAAWRSRVWAAATDPESLRAWSVIANDGIIATAGILEGFAGAGAGHATLVTAATSATIAGMLSAGGSEWAEAAAEREGQLSAAAEEAADLARQPEVERGELIAYYERRDSEANSQQKSPRS